jgi:SAM-dependent methyltransferase
MSEPVKSRFSTSGDRRGGSSYDRVARFYDYDMGLSAPEGDVAFYVKAAVRAGGPVLELGCGTGRISLPLVEAGCPVVGIDVSLPMLQQMSWKASHRLSSRSRSRLHWACMDMTHLGIEQSFDLVVCPYSAFTYLLTDEDQSRCLSGVRTLLSAEGRFILDVFIPRYEFLCEPDDRIIFDYRREVGGGQALERHKTIEKDKTAQVNCVTRYYRLLTSSGSLVEEFTTQECIRYFFHSELRLLLKQEGFEVLAEYGDFGEQPYRYEARMMVFVCKVGKQLA